MHPTRHDLISQGRLLPGIRELRTDELLFIDANSPGVVFLGTRDDLGWSSAEGGAPHRVARATALDLLRSRDPVEGFFWDLVDLPAARKDAKGARR